MAAPSRAARVTARDILRHVTAPTAIEPPYVDEHTRVVAASPEDVWAALGDVFTGTSTRRRTRIGVTLLGCEDRTATGDLAVAGSTIAGFHVTAARRGEELRLEGRHRFSRYVLTFRIAPLDDARTRLTAVTHAAFPGIGRAYGALVVGTGLHRIATRGLLRTIARAA